MQNSEIAEGLRKARTAYEGRLRDCIDAARALIDPQPITEAALREAGFRKTVARGYWGDDCETEYELRLGRYSICCCTYKYRFAMFGRDGAVVPLPGITDMATLRAVIAALGGEVQA